MSLQWVSSFVYHYSECHYAERCYAECDGALLRPSPFSTVVEHSPHHPKVEGLSPATTTGSQEGKNQGRLAEGEGSVQLTSSLR